MSLMSISSDQDQLSKSPALVIGNGPSAICSPLYGEIIDQFCGVIVRFNRCKIQGLERFVGTRTDIWSSCGNIGVRELGQQINLLGTHIHFSEASEKDWRKFQRDSRQHESVSLATYNQTVSELQAYPSSGVLVINHLLNSGYNIWIHGFDFFNPAIDHHYYEQGRVTLAANGHQPLKEAAWFFERVRRGLISIWHPAGIKLPEIESISQLGLFLGRIGLKGRGVLVNASHHLLEHTLMHYSPLSVLSVFENNVCKTINLLDLTSRQETVSATHVSASCFVDNDLDFVFLGHLSNHRSALPYWLPKLTHDGILSGRVANGVDESDLRLISDSLDMHLKVVQDQETYLWVMSRNP